MFPAFTDRGLPPSIADVFQYYYDPTPQLPSGERLAHILYWATQKRAVAKAQLGYVDVTIGGEFWHIASTDLDHRYAGHKIAVLPIPDSDSAILMLADNPSDPRYIATGRQGYLRSLNDIREVKPMIGSIRKEVLSRLRTERQAVPPMPWVTTAPRGGTVPALPEDTAAWIEGERMEVEVMAPGSLDRNDDQHLDDLLTNADNLLD
ncbi:MAG: hypothetical protein ABI876_09250, partial [Bacteroidota bacterium]